MVTEFNEPIWELDTQSRRLAYEAADKFEHPLTCSKVYYAERRVSLQSEIPGATVIPADSFPMVSKGLNISVPESYKILAPSTPLFTSVHAKLPESCTVPHFSYVSCGSTQGYLRSDSNPMEMTGLEVVILKTFPLGIKTALAKHAIPTEKNIQFMDALVLPQTDTLLEFIDVNFEGINNYPPVVMEQPFMASVPLPHDRNFHPEFLRNSSPFPAAIYKLMTLAVLHTYSGPLQKLNETWAKFDYFLPGAKVVAYSTSDELQLSVPLVPEFHPFDALEPVCTVKAHKKRIDQPYKFPYPGFVIKWYTPQCSKDLLALVLHFDKNRRPASPKNLHLLQNFIQAKLLIDRWSIDNPDPTNFELILAVARASI